MYSVLGAAAFCGSVTRTVSVAVIVLELNGHLSHAVPTMVCVLCSYTISEWIKPCSFFEMLSQLGGLDDKISANGRYMIRDIIDQNEEEYKTFSFLSYDDNSELDLLKLVLKNSDPKDSNRLRFIPVVDNSANMNLLYIVRTAELY